MHKLLILLSMSGYWLLAPVLPAGSMEAEFLAAQSPAQPAHYFNDYGSLIDVRTAQQLDQRLEDFERQTSNQIVVVIYGNLPAHPAIKDFALTAFRTWKIGEQGKNNRVLLVVLMADKQIRITTGKGLEATLTDDWCGRLIAKEIIPRFQQGDFAGGLQELKVNSSFLMLCPTRSGTILTYQNQRRRT